MSRTSRSAMVVTLVCFVLFCVFLANARNAVEGFELDRLNQNLDELSDNAAQYDDILIAGENAETQEQFNNKGIEGILRDDEPQHYLTRLEKRAEPEPIALYPLNGQYGTKEINGRAPAGQPSGVKLAQGPDGKGNGSYEFAGNANSYIQFPNNGALDTQYSMTMLCWVYPANDNGPLFNYKISGQWTWGVHLWISGGRLSVAFRKRNSAASKYLTSTRLAKGKWSYVGASYDRGSGEEILWVDGKVARTRNIGSNLQLATQDDVRMGAKVGVHRYFKGKIAQMRVYNVALNQQQVQNARKEIIQANARNAVEGFELGRLNQNLGELSDNAAQYDDILIAGENAETQEQFNNKGIEGIPINLPVVAGMAAVTALCAITLLFMAFNNRKSPTAKYVTLETDHYT